MTTQSDLEAAFLQAWRAFAPDAPWPVSEYRFDSYRRWRLDFAWPDAKVGVEMQGGTWTEGRHTRGKGYDADCEKANALHDLGWRVYRITASMLKRNPAGMVAMVREAIG